jgi:hypothetical protein
VLHNTDVTKMTASGIATRINPDEQRTLSLRTVHTYMIGSRRVLKRKLSLPMIQVVLLLCCGHRPGSSGVTRNFFSGGVSTNSVEDRENGDGDLGVLAP